MYKIVYSHGTVLGVAVVDHGGNCTEDEYARVSELLRALPAGMVLTEDLEYAEHTAPDPAEQEISAEEALSQIQEVLGYEA